MKHFSEVDLLELAYLPPGEGTGAMLHVADCDECRQKYDRLQEKLRGISTDACRTVDEKPETFWSRQRLSILRSIEEQRRANAFSRTRSRAAGVAAAIALIVGSAVMMRHEMRPAGPAPQVAAHAAPVVSTTVPTAPSTDSDQVLQELQASHDPWNSDELRSYHGVVAWESWVSDSNPGGGAL